MAVSIGSEAIGSVAIFSETESKTALEFVTFSNPKDVLTASNQRRIRQHARKSAPDAGRGRRKGFSRTFELTQIQPPSLNTVTSLPRDRSIVRTNLATTRPSHQSIPSNEYYSADEFLSAVPIRGIANGSRFPIELTTRMKELIGFSKSWWARFVAHRADHAAMKLVKMLQ